MKICGKCGEQKQLEEFYFRNKAKRTRQVWCKSCKKEHHKNYYQDNKDAWRSSNNAARAKIRKYIQDIKESNPCTDCGNFYPYYVMDFDHLDASLKNLAVSYMVNHGLNKVKEEIAKCELVCANCHRKRTHMRL